MRKLLIASFCIMLSLAFTHPLKMSICEIRLNKRATSTINFRFFEDDFQENLRVYGERPSLDLFAQNPKDFAVLKKYVLSHFSLQQKGKTLAIEITDYEFSDADLVVLVHTQVKLLANEDIKVNNTLMTDAFSTQKNLVFLFGENDKKEVLELDADETQGSFKGLL